MYKDIMALLKSSGADSSIKVTVMTGSGDYYCSGNDLSNFLDIPPEGPEHLATEGATLLRLEREGGREREGRREGERGRPYISCY